jgi:glyoxylase-like metal-dependent hydrolase (beta-lactamase superfamily II)
MDYKEPLMRHATFLALFLAVPTLAFAAEPVGVQRKSVGKIELLALQDGEIQLPATLMKGIETDKAQAMLGGKDKADTSINVFLVRMPDKLVLVDTGVGGDGKGPTGHLMERLAAAGVDPAKIDLILITHFHFDHTGGLVKPDGSRAFPNAVVRVAQAEHDAWLGENAKLPDMMKDRVPALKAALAPYQAAGAYKPFAPKDDLGKGIRAMSSFGHTGGHTSYAFSVGGKEAWVVGDLIHFGAVQFAQPKVAVVFDSDQDKAVAARREYFKKAAASGTVIGATHLAFPGLVQLKVKGDSFVATPVK